MSPPTTMERPAATRRPAAGAASRPAAGTGLAMIAVVALVAASLLPLTRVYVGLGFLRPVVAAALLSLLVAWGARRLGAGPLSALGLSLLAWALYTSVAFAPLTLAGGLLPTWDTPAALRDLWLRGIELIRMRPAPAFPEAGMLLITSTGVWWVAHAVEGLVFRLQAPLRAIAMGLLLWTVPLAMAPRTPRPWLWAAPYFVAAAALLMVSQRADLQRWGSGGTSGRSASPAQRRAPVPRRGGDGIGASAWIIAVAAVAASAVLAGLLPGYGQAPLYELESLGGSTITTNPIVSIRANLVGQGDRPVVEMRTPRPVYLRLTALDVYSDREEWTSAGIRGGSASGRLPAEIEWAQGTELTVEVQVRDLGGAVIVPVPYQPVALSGPVSDRFAYDRDGATVTLEAGEALEPGDTYTVEAVIPRPAPEVLAAASVTGAPPSLTALPDTVPAEVAALARGIVARAGATTPFEQAMALQRELRGWQYSLDPPQGHGSSAMRSFIEQRVGYCEQFAGTMAVMLRSLGIPSRVAVGYTPGALVATEDGLQTYVVTGRNAHAWVEVLFPRLGWIAFEPTPRSDGNLLTPTPANLAPSSTDAQLGALAGDVGDAPPADQEFLERLPEARETTGPLGAQGGDGGASGGLPASTSVAGGLLAALVLAGAVAVGARARRRGPLTLVPSAAVLRAVARVRRAGRGLGIAPRGWETDREYLVRLAGPVAPARDLAEVAGRARYATRVPAADAGTADQAADLLVTGLRRERSRARWALAVVRGWLASATALVVRRRPEGGEDTGSERLARLIRRRSASERRHG